jgi:hypothetical protein
LLSIVYSSSATTEFSDSDLAVLLMNSRANNRRYDLTGLLLYREGRFVQLLEGPMDTVRERMAVIAADPRHDQVEIQLEEVTPHRRFPTWTMGYEPVTDTMADEIPGYRSTFDDITGRAPAQGGTELAIRQLIGWFEGRA